MIHFRNVTRKVASSALVVVLIMTSMIPAFADTTSSGKVRSAAVSNRTAGVISGDTSTQMTKSQRFAAKVSGSSSDNNNSGSSNSSEPANETTDPLIVDHSDSGSSTSFIPTTTAEENALTIYNFVTQTMGCTRVTACAILGNFEQESGLISTSQSRSGSYGLAQFTGTRKTNLISWCQKNGYDYTSTIGQLNFMQYEIQSYKPFKNMLQKINDLPDNSASVVEATNIFEKTYEAAGKPNMAAREKYAQKWWNLLTAEA